MDKPPANSPAIVPRKHNVVFTTVSSMFFGVGVLVTTAALVEGVHASWLAKKLRLPDSEGVRELLMDGGALNTTMNAAIVGLFGAFGFVGAHNYNKKLDEMANRTR